MIPTKKGQGLSLTVIVVAALALIVLVVLVAVFVGRIGTTTEGIDKASQAELIVMQVTYGDCRPSASGESSFTIRHSQATTDQLKEEAKVSFKDEITRCKGLSNDRSVCESGGCSWR